MTPEKSQFRKPSIDFLRGLVIILMAVDHTQFFWYQDGLPNDGLEGVFYTYPTVAHHITRYLSHLCAPAFLFLAGMMLAWKNSRTYAMSRGIILILLQFTLENIAWGPKLYLETGYAYFGILSCLGVSMILCALLSYLKPIAILFFSLGLLLAPQFLYSNASLVPHFLNSSLSHTITDWLQIISIIFYAPTLNHQYPMTSLFTIVPWAGFMGVGFYFGVSALRHPRTPPAWSASSSGDLLFKTRIMILLGTLGLILFLIIRLSHGNSLFSHEFFIFSKYPPDLSFLTLTSGIMFLILGLAIRFESILEHKIFGPILLFGQTSLFFYIAHLYLYGAVSNLYGRINVGIGTVWVIWTVGLVIMYFICREYKNIKSKYPQSFLKFI